MSKQVDSRVLEMRFDNKQFESNVSTSISTLDKLKKSLNLSGAAKGLDDLNASAKKCDVSGIGNGVDTVKAKFSALQVVAATALANITNSAVNAGKRIVSALTIDPIKDGFSEYETKINAVQTIMSNTASKGTTMKDITAVLDDLNTYADKTIYNFAEMTRNIGTFTAAGVGLKESASAIKGIANLAAASGSNSQQASTAMYQLSQALAAGKVNLQDWNSVVNAGMGGQKFQEALKATAREHGVAVDDIIKKQGSFRESLQKGWMTADILNETLSKFTVEGAKEYAKSMMDSGKWTQKQADALIKEAQSMEDAATKVKTFTQLIDTLKEAMGSGWAQSWEIIFGDFEEAKEFFTEISDTLGDLIGKSADARNQVLQGWKDLGGRTAMIDAIRNAFEGIMSVVKPIGEAFREIFPPITAKQLYNFSVAIKELTSHMKLSESTANNLKRTFKGIFSVFSIVVQAITAVVKGFGQLISALTGIPGGILAVTAVIGDMITGFRNAVTQSNIFEKVVSGIVKVITKVIDKFKEMGTKIGEAFRMPTMDGFVSALDGIWNLLVKIVSTVAEGLGNVGNTLAEAFNSADFFDALNGGIFATILLGVKKFVDGISDVTENFGGTFEGIKETLDGVRGCFEAYQNQLNAQALIKIAIAIGILAGALLLLSGIDGESLARSLGALGILFLELIGSMILLEKASVKLKHVFKTMTMMIGMAIAIDILASALKKLSDLSWEGIAKGLAAVGALMVELAVFLKVANFGGSTITAATGIVILAAAMLILAKAVKDFASMQWEDIGKGLTAIGALLMELALFTNLTAKAGHVLTTAAAMIVLAYAMKMFAGVLKDFSAFQWDELARGLTGLAGTLIAVAAALNLMPKSSILIGAGLIVVAKAINDLVAPLKSLSGMSWEEIAKGLTTLTLALASISLALNFMPKTTVLMGAGLLVVAEAINNLVPPIQKLGNLSIEQIAKGLSALTLALASISLALRFMPMNAVIIGAGLLVVAEALSKITVVVSSFGNMAWESIARGLVALAGSLVILAVALNAMRGTLMGAAALVVAAGALAIIAPIITSFGGMSWEAIAKGLIALAGAFTVIGVAGVLLTPLIPALIGLSAALALFGVAAMAVGAGIALLAAGLGTLAAVGVAGATAFVAALRVLIEGVLGLIPSIISAFGEIITALCQVIGECAPQLADAIMKLISEVLASLANYGPQIVDSLLKFVIDILNGLAVRIPELVAAFLNVLSGVFEGIKNAIGGLDASSIIKGVGMMAALTALTYALAGLVTLIPSAMIGVLGVGAVIAELSLVLAALGALAQIPGLEWFISEGGNLLQQVGTAIGQFVGGIVGGALEGISSTLPAVGASLSGFMTNLQPFIEGAKSIDPSMGAGIAALADAVLKLTGAGLLEAITSFVTGGSSLADFANQLVPFGAAMMAYSASVAGIDSNAIVESANAAQALSDVANALPNSGGLIAKITGDNTLASFAQQLVPFGAAMMAYSASVAGINTAAITESAKGAQALSEVAQALPNSGGLVSLATGDNTLSSFAQQLVPFGAAMKSYAESVAGIDVSAVTTSVSAAKGLVEVANLIPNSGGIVAIGTGDNTMSSFGKQIVTFGEKLKEYSEAVAGTDVGVIVSSVGAARYLANLANDLVDFDSTGITLFDSVSKIGDTLRNYASNVASVDMESVNASIDSIRRLANLARSLDGVNATGLINFTAALSRVSVDGVNKIVKAYRDAAPKLEQAVNNLMKSMTNGINKGNPALVKAAVQAVSDALAGIKSKATYFTSAGQEMMSKLTSGLKAGASGAKKVVDSLMKSVTNGIKSLSFKDLNTGGVSKSLTNSLGKTMRSAGKSIANNLAEGMKSGMNGITAATNNIVTNISKIITGKYSSFNSMGSKLGSYFARGVRSASGACKTAGAALGSAAVAGAQGYYSSMYSAGSNAGRGFANGLKASISNAAAAAKSQAQSAVNAIKNILDINSPSKVMYQLGAYSGQGFVNGLSEYARIAYNASSDVALSAKDGLGSTLSRISDLINSDIDAQPTIRPVLDLSEITAGAGAIDSLLNGSNTIAAVANVKGINSMMSRNQNGANDLLAMEINKLRRDLGKVGNTTYSVNGITYGDGTEVSSAIKSLIRAAKIERRS